MDIFGNIVFLGGKLLILAFLVYVWWWLLAVEKDYIVFVMLTIVMILGSYCGYRAAKAEMGA
ncbi:MAG: hypothetical protein GX465_15225 [Acidobacteria bacterium]|jgi:hypothetical protein|nr:hypothetical protein [Acidobacteriota bacterium]